MRLEDIRNGAHRRVTLSEMAHVIYRHLWLSAIISSLCVIAEKDTSNRDTPARSFTQTVRLKRSESSDSNLQLILSS